MKKILTIIINHYWLHFFISKIYVALTAPYAVISSFLRKSGLIKTKNMDGISKLKDAHKGGRCFIVGNGPSLSASDLDKLTNEITFGFNAVHLMFSETSWRPTYYMIADQNDYIAHSREISKFEMGVKLVGGNCKKYGKKIDDALYFYTRLPLNPMKPKFSADALKYLSDGNTVVYFALQMAAYMGFKEIYLTGVDFSYSSEFDSRGKVIQNSDTQNYFSKEYVKDKKTAYTREMLAAYKAAGKYADTHGISIYNATRGGKLDVFPKADLDEIELK